MNRKELIKVATEMKLVFKGNAKTAVIQKLVDTRIELTNEMLIDTPAPSKTMSNHKATFCGKHPITGEAVYK